MEQLHRTWGKNVQDCNITGPVDPVELQGYHQDFQQMVQPYEQVLEVVVGHSIHWSPTSNEHVAGKTCPFKSVYIYISFSTYIVEEVASHKSQKYKDEHILCIYIYVYKQYMQNHDQVLGLVRNRLPHRCAYFFRSGLHGAGMNITRGIFRSRGSRSRGAIPYKVSLHPSDNTRFFPHKMQFHSK